MKKGIFAAAALLLAAPAWARTQLEEDDLAMYRNAPAEAVDLGLSVKWSPINLGAVGLADFGYYFCWGETEPKAEYTRDNCSWIAAGQQELLSRGVIDDRGNLTAEYDAATALWGDGWRTPTIDELRELLDECTWTWSPSDGVDGYEVTGPSGNAIFLPAAGYRSGEYRYDGGTDGNYMCATCSSSPVYGTSVCVLDFSSTYPHLFNFGYLFYGRPIRPVSP